MSKDTLLTFPCRFPVKIMGRNHAGFINDMLIMLRRHSSDIAEDAITSRTSSSGKYLAVTITFTATSKNQIDAMYRELHTHPDVKMML